MKTVYRAHNVDEMTTRCTAGFCDSQTEACDTSSRWVPGNDNRRRIIRCRRQIGHSTRHWQTQRDILCISYNTRL